MRICLLHPADRKIGNWILPNVAKKKAILIPFARKEPAAALPALMIATGIADVSALILITRAAPAATKKAKAKAATDCIKNVVTSAQIILIRQATCRQVMLKARAATAAAEPNTKPVVIRPTNILAPAATKAGAPALLVMANINLANASPVMVGTPQPALAILVVIRLINLIASKAPAPTLAAVTAPLAMGNISVASVPHLIRGVPPTTPAPAPRLINTLVPAPVTPAAPALRVMVNIPLVLVARLILGHPVLVSAPQLINTLAQVPVIQVVQVLPVEASIQNVPANPVMNGKTGLVRKKP